MTAMSDEGRVRMTESGIGDLIVEERCPNCGRYLRLPETVRIVMRGRAIVRVEGYECRECGAVNPRARIGA